MGNLVMYRASEDALGDVAKGRWIEMRRLLPALIDYLNDAMQQDWSSGARRSVAVSASEAAPGAPASTVAPQDGPFSLDGLLRDESRTSDEIHINDADELVRLFKWFSFLQERDGAAGLYEPLVKHLRMCTHGIERFLSGRPQGAG